MIFLVFCRRLSSRLILAWLRWVATAVVVAVAATVATAVAVVTVTAAVVTEVSFERHDQFIELQELGINDIQEVPMPSPWATVVGERSSVET